MAINGVKDLLNWNNWTFVDTMANKGIPPLSDNLDINVVDTGIRIFADMLLNLAPGRQLIVNLGFQALHKVATDRYRWPIPIAAAFFIPNIKTKGVGKALDVMANLLYESMVEWMKPNLGGIIINATTETQSRQVEISENMIIIQTGAAGNNKEYNTDNSVPYPRTWTVEGYLSSNAPWVDEHFILRPTLVWQQMMLDAYASSRKPILYKSGLSPLTTLVLIENYEIGRVTDGTNGYSIKLSLREFVTYTVPIYNGGGGRAFMQGAPDTGSHTANQSGPPPGGQQ